MPDPARAAAIVASDRSVSDKIRALAKAGFSRAEIANAIDRSYQQVRQVLLEDERRARRQEPVRTVASPPRVAPTNASGVEDAGETFGGIWRLDLEADGVVRLPAVVQAALGVQEGSVLICELEEGALRILGPRAAWERARSLLNLPPATERNLVDELIADRRAEAAREERND